MENMLMVKTVDQRLHEAAALFAERNAAYGSNYLTFGDVAHAMMPNGAPLSTPDQWRRMVLFCHLLTKLTRYAQNLSRGQGHTDSMEDLAVYAMMANETDELSVAHLAQAWETCAAVEPPPAPGTDCDDTKNSSIHQNAVPLEVSLVARGAVLSGSNGMSERLVPRQVHEDPFELDTGDEWRR